MRWSFPAQSDSLPKPSRHSSPVVSSSSRRNIHISINTGVWSNMYKTNFLSFVSDPASNVSPEEKTPSKNPKRKAGSTVPQWQNTTKQSITRICKIPEQHQEPTEKSNRGGFPKQGCKPSGQGTSRPYQRVKGCTGRFIIVHHGTRESNEKTMQLQNNRMPAPACPSS